MRTCKAAVTAIFFLFFIGLMAQNPENKDPQPIKTETGHTNQNKFRQLYDVFATPNQYRTASGAPGPAYYQNMADYKMDIELDDKNLKITGSETITYHNNSPNELKYLWVQLDQNIRAKGSPEKLKDSNGFAPVIQTNQFVEDYMKDEFEGGFNITELSSNGNALSYKINFTMMRIDLPQPLKSGESFSFDVKWWYNLNNHVLDGARSGYEHFEKDGNNTYTIAQFYPRMAVYDDVEGWQNYQFWGDGEYALPFGNYEVNITVPADHILDGTGRLINRKEVFSKEMLNRYKKAKKSYDKPVLIVTESEAREAEKGFFTKKKTWKLKADRVRDFAFASSRKFIWDMMAVDLGKEGPEGDVMAVSLYPKEGNPLWEDLSSKVVAHTLESYSKRTFDYPYPKAISVHAKNQGMEYPMICWNHGRPKPNGEVTDGVRFAMIGVIIHEVGHNFFPMIVNSDERQWGWLDEGLNSFLEYLAEQEFGEKYPDVIAPLTKFPSRRGEPTKVIPYMKGDQKRLSPIMSNPENVNQLGSNAYTKPVTALNILRETVMGRELFDYAFKTYAEGWMFKHPTPEDFFRTMEDASAVDLDWFWRGWFYTTDYVDIAVKEVKQFYITDKPGEEGIEILKRFRVSDPSKIEALYPVSADREKMDAKSKTKNTLENTPTLKSYLMDNFSVAEREAMKTPKYFYEITYAKPGGLVMPLLVEYTYADGSNERVRYPVQIWRKNDQQVSRVLATDKQLVKVVVDPENVTADVNTSNNTWSQSE